MPKASTKKTTKTPKAKKKPKSKNPVGRPTAYKPEYCKVLIDVAETKYTPSYVVVCCNRIGIARETFNQWTKKYPDFQDAYKTGRGIWLEKLGDIYFNGTVDWKAYRTSYYQGTQESCEPSTKTENKNTLSIDNAEVLQKLMRDSLANEDEL